MIALLQFMSDNVCLHRKKLNNENEVKTLKSYQGLSSLPVLFCQSEVVWLFFPAIVQ